jgi:hypothetical protein
MAALLDHAVRQMGVTESDCALGTVRAWRWIGGRFNSLGRSKPMFISLSRCYSGLLQLHAEGLADGHHVLEPPVQIVPGINILGRVVRQHVELRRRIDAC